MARQYVSNNRRYRLAQFVSLEGMVCRGAQSLVRRTVRHIMTLLQFTHPQKREGSVGGRCSGTSVQGTIRQQCSIWHIVAQLAAP